VTSHVFQLLLIALLAFAGGWVWRGVWDLFGGLRSRPDTITLDAAARGDVLHLDWSDPRDDNPREAA